MPTLGHANQNLLDSARDGREQGLKASGQDCLGLLISAGADLDDMSKAKDGSAAPPGQAGSTAHRSAPESVEAASLSS